MASDSSGALPPTGAAPPIAPKMLAKCHFAIDRTSNPCPAFSPNVSALVTSTVAAEFGNVAVTLDDVDRRLRVILLGPECDVLAARMRIYDLVLSKVTMTFFLPEECADSAVLARVSEGIAGTSIDGVIKAVRLLGQASITITAPVEKLDSFRGEIITTTSATAGWSSEAVDVPREHLPLFVSDGDFIHGVEQTFRVSVYCPYPPSSRSSVTVLGRQPDAVSGAAGRLRERISSLSQHSTTLSVVVPHGQLSGLVAERERRIHAIASATATFLALPPAASNADLVTISGRMDACLRATSLLLEAAKGALCRVEVPSEHVITPLDAAAVAARTGACVLQPIVALSGGTLHVVDPSRPVVVVGDSACVEPALNLLDRRNASAVPPVPLPLPLPLSLSPAQLPLGIVGGLPFGYHNSSVSLANSTSPI
eukprot:Opistho-2@16758